MNWDKNHGYVQISGFSSWKIKIYLRNQGMVWESVFLTIKCWPRKNSKYHIGFYYGPQQICPPLESILDFVPKHIWVTDHKMHSNNCLIFIWRSKVIINRNALTSRSLFQKPKIITKIITCKTKCKNIHTLKIHYDMNALKNPSIAFNSNDHKN